MEAVDNVWLNNIDNKILGLARIHDTLHIPKEVESDPITGVVGLVSENEIDRYDRETIVKSLHSLGLQVDAKSTLSTKVLARLHDNIASFWFNSKGARDIEHFIGYIIGTKIRIEPLITNDYLDFSELGEQPGAVFLEDGGSWYLTSHINVYVDRATLIEVDEQGIKDIITLLLPYTTVVNRWFILNF
jgi:hypothetical protein